MDRAEATGVGVAVAGHAALLAALALGFANAKLPPIQNKPIEVSFVDEVGLESTAPTPSAVEPAPKLAEIEGPVEPEPLPAAEPLPVPVAAVPAPAPVPKPAVRPQPQRPAPAKPKSAPPKAAPRKAPAQKATGSLTGLLDGISDRPSPSRSTTPPAAKAGPAVKASLGAEVRRQLKPHWKAPTGADAEQLRTELSIWLAPSGAVTRVEVLRTTGQTASNQPQVKRHQEQAVKAVRLAEPFRLPAEYYDEWKLLSPIGFDRRLSQ